MTCILTPEGRGLAVAGFRELLVFFYGLEESVIKTYIKNKNYTPHCPRYNSNIFMYAVEFERAKMAWYTS